jgi:hypothetical protein
VLPNTRLKAFRIAIPTLTIAVAPTSEGHNERKQYMRFKRLAAAIGAVLLVGGVASTAYAASTINPTSVPADAAPGDPGLNITVTSTGLTNPFGQTVFYQQCWRSTAAPFPGAPAFNPTNDCSAFNQLIGTIDAQGNASTVFTVFNGDEFLQGDWACGPGTASNPSSAPTISQTCFIRIVPGDPSNVSAQEFAQYTYAPRAQVPEVPLNVLLPASAAVILGAGFLVARKRHNAQTPA